MVDMRVHPLVEPTEEVCVMCGEEPPTTVVLNPNAFPGEDDDDDRTWDVCDGCKVFIEGGVEDGMRMHACMFLVEKCQMKLSDIPSDLKPESFDIGDVIDMVAGRGKDR